jgi:hypothetical protein
VTPTNAHIGEHGGLRSSSSLVVFDGCSMTSSRAARPREGWKDVILDEKEWAQTFFFFKLN